RLLLLLERPSHRLVRPLPFAVGGAVQAVDERHADDAADDDDAGEQADGHEQGRGGGAAPRPLDAALDEADAPRLDRLPLEIAAQIVRQGLGTGIALLRLLFQALKADGLQVTWHALLQAPRRQRLLLLHLLERVQHAFAAERSPAGDALVQDRSQSIDIRG